MGDCSEVLRDELEALLSTFGEELHIVEGHNITMMVCPTNHAQQFVQAAVSLTVDPLTYPTTMPRIRIECPQGMSDQRVEALLQGLQQEAEHLAGEMVLGHLLAMARDVLEEMNSPEGGRGAPLVGALLSACDGGPFHACRRHGVSPATLCL